MRVRVDWERNELRVPKGWGKWIGPPLTAIDHFVGGIVAECSRLNGYDLGLVWVFILQVMLVLKVLGL